MNLKQYKKNRYTWPGGYQVNAITGDGAMMCHKCATTEKEVYEGKNPPQDGNDLCWQVIGFEVHWEGPPEQCAHCYCELPSEYGDPIGGAILEGL